jgi:hypothetical protein
MDPTDGIGPLSGGASVYPIIGMGNVFIFGKNIIILTTKFWNLKQIWIK